ncbi:MAG: hypothetical protein ACREUA_08420 [Burkholderiales bacterium]
MNTKYDNHFSDYLSETLFDNQLGELSVFDDFDNDWGSEENDADLMVLWSGMVGTAELRADS